MTREQAWLVAEVFDDFLREKGVRIPSSDKEKAEQCDYENDVIIYGCDYGELIDMLEATDIEEV